MNGFDEDGILLSINLFKPAIAKKVLLHYLNELESKRTALLDYKVKSDEALLAALCLNNPKLGCKQILQMLGLKKALELHTPRELRVLFSQTHNATGTDSWQMQRKLSCQQQTAHLK